MRQVSPIVVAAVLSIALMVGCATLLLPGGLFINFHPNDAIRNADIVLRMYDGQLPHRDFMTPIGIVMFWPFMPFMKLGFAGAYIGAQILWAVLLAPLIFWVVWSRFSLWTGVVFTLAIVIVLTAMIHGGTRPLVGISMYYNRWAWSVAWLVIVMVLLSPKDSRFSIVEGIVFGILLSVLALGKATFFVALFPAVLFALLTRQAWVTLLVGTVCGLIAATLVTIAAGQSDFLLLYIRDLIAVATDSPRPFPRTP